MQVKHNTIEKFQVKLICAGVQSLFTQVTIKSASTKIVIIELLHEAAKFGGCSKRVALKKVDPVLEARKQQLDL